MYGYIYKTTCLINNKIYIGQHRYNKFDIKYFGSGKLLKRAILKYGKENFKVELLKECLDRDDLNNSEIYYINKFNSRNTDIGYNICKGGERGPGGPMFKGHKHSLETRHNMSEDRKGSKNANYGNRWHQSDELRQLHLKLSSGSNNGMYGKHQSDSARLKISKKAIGRIWINNKIIDKRIKQEELQYYINQGWYIGRLSARGYK